MFAAAIDNIALEYDAMDGLAAVSWSASSLACREKKLLQMLMAADMMCCTALGSRYCREMNSGWELRGQHELCTRFLLWRYHFCD